MKPSHYPSSIWRNPVHFLAFGFGSGASPFAPGTAGTVVAIPVFMVLAPLTLWYYLLAVLVLLVAGIWLCGRTSRDLGVHDHSGIVWDEIVGYLITMIAVPVEAVWIIAGFFLFRFFDIIKPWPINWIDKKMAGGTGIMMDDVLAGIYSLISLQIILRFVYP